MLEGGYHRKDGERASVITLISRNVALIALLYCLILAAYTVTVVALVRKDPKLSDSQRPVQHRLEIAKAIGAANFRYTVESFWKRAPFPQGSGVIISRVKAALYGKNFLPFHVLIHGLAFAFIGYLAGKRRLENHTLIYPLVLFFATTSLLSADLYRPPKDTNLLLSITVILQFAAVYGCALWAKWSSR